MTIDNQRIARTTEDNTKFYIELDQDEDDDLYNLISTSHKGATSNCDYFMASSVDTVVNVSYSIVEKSSIIQDPPIASTLPQPQLKHKKQKRKSKKKTKSKSNSLNGPQPIQPSMHHSTQSLTSQLHKKPQSNPTVVSNNGAQQQTKWSATVNSNKTNASKSGKSNSQKK